MKLNWEDIVCKKNVLIKKGCIYIPNSSITLLCAPNGFGKSIFVEKISQAYNGILIAQNNNIITQLSVEDNILLGSGDRNKLNFILEKYNLESLLKLNTSTLSGGERRLVAILRALCTNNDFIVLDEPTNDLDFDSVKTLIKLINDEKNKITFLIVSHDDRIREIADLKLTIEHQKIIGIDEKQVKTLDKTIRLNKNISSGNFSSLTISRKFWKKMVYARFIFIVIVLVSVSFFLAEIDNKNYIVYDEIANDEAFLFMDQYSMIGEEYKTAGGVYANFLMYGRKYKAVQYSIKQGIILNSENFYPIELYDKHTRQYYDIIEVYKDEYERLDAVIDTSDYFYDYFHDSDEYEHVEKLDIEKYKVLLKKLTSNKDIVVTFAIVNCGGYKDDKDLLENVKGDINNLWILSNSTIKLQNNINKLRYYKLNILMCFIVSGIINSVYCLVCALYWKNERSNIQILLNYRYDKNDLKSLMILRTCDRKSNCLITILLIIICIYGLNITGEDIIALMILISNALVITTSFAACRKIITINIKNAYNNYRL